MSSTIFSTLIFVGVLNLNAVFGVCPTGQFAAGSGCLPCRCQTGSQVCDPNLGCNGGHCAFGYKGMPTCQTPCPPGMFGIDCSSVCHCTVGDTCSPQNGLCHSNKCLYKWTGPSCQKRLPEMLVGPNVRVDSSEDMTVTWDRWSATTGIGQGPIAYYQLQYNKQGETEWHSVTTIQDSPVNTTYSYLVQCLEPATFYSFRLVLAMAMEDKQKLSVPSAQSAYFKTLSTAATKSSTYAGLGKMGDSALPTTSIPSPSNVVLMGKTSQSFSLHWDPLTPSTNIGYQIGVLLVESYTGQEITGQTIIYTSTNNYYDIFSLQPASKYKVTITAFESTSGVASLPLETEFWTLPDPLPSPTNPMILNVTHTMMFVEIYALNHTGSPINDYKIIVEDISGLADDNFRRNSVEITLGTEIELQLLGYNDSMAAGLNYYVALQIESASISTSGSVLLIGDNTTTQDYRNAPLQTSLKYIIWVFVTSELDGVKHRSLAKSLQYAIPGVGVFNDLAQTRKTRNAKAAIIACSVIFTLLFLLLICLVVMFFISKRIAAREDDEPSVNMKLHHHRQAMLEKLSKLKAARGLSFITSTPVSDKEKLNKFYSRDEIDLDRTGLEVRVPSVTSEYTSIKKSAPIPCKELSHYYDKHSFTIIEEFKHLPDRVEDNFHIALNPENHTLNRSVRSLACDTNRVRLIRNTPVENDYINASKIKTHMHRFYIVTQAPMENTISHFWKMVWQQNVDTVVMLMDLDKPSNNIYEQYWPPTEIGSVLYGDIEVRQLVCTTLAHYTVRWIELAMITDDEREVRNLAHFQYRTWSDSGIPNHPIAFLDFMHRIKDTHQESSNIVVHCHMGTGRSGMYVAIDTLLYQGKTTGKVDIAKCVTVLRMERSNLVRTQPQYKFIYEALIEAFHHRDTRLEGSKFEFTYENMLSISSSECRSIIATEFDSVVLKQRESGLNKSLKWKDYSVYISPSKRNNTLSKGLPNQSILNDDTSKLLITHLDGHRKKENFIITLYPKKEEKIFQFWDMVYRLDSPAVVMINDTEIYQPPYWPAQGDSFYGDNSSVTTKTTKCDPTNTFYIREIEIKQGYSKSAPKKSVMHFQYISWPTRKDAPSVSHMLNFMQQIKSWYSKMEHVGPLIVHSANGVSRGTLFCVLWAVIERLEEEDLVDIYHTTRYYRSFVTASVTNLDQYRFLYKAVREQLTWWRQQRNSAAVLNIQESTSRLSSTTSYSSGDPINPPVKNVNFQLTFEEALPFKSTNAVTEVSIIKSDEKKFLKSTTTMNKSSTPKMMQNTDKIDQKSKQLLSTPKSKHAGKSSLKSKDDSVRKKLYPKLVSSSNTSGDVKPEKAKKEEMSHSQRSTPDKIRSKKKHSKNISGDGNLNQHLRIEKHKKTKSVSVNQNKTKIQKDTKQMSDSKDKAESAIRQKQTLPGIVQKETKPKEAIKQTDSMPPKSPMKVKENVLDELKTKVAPTDAPRRSRFTNYTMYPSSEESEDDEDEAFLTLSV